MFEKRLHPGPRHPVRRFHSIPQKPVHLRAQLAPSNSLHAAMIAIMAKNNLATASLSLFGGSFAQLKFTTGAAETRQGSVKQANYTYFREWTDCALLQGAASVGIDREGAPLLHCHATFFDQAGALFGGHLLPEDCMIGQPVTAYITAHPAACLQQGVDPETMHMIFNPIIEARPDVF